MSDLAERHRQIADVLEPLEQMGIDATVKERATDDGELCLTLNLGVPSALDSSESHGPQGTNEMLEAQCEKLREEQDVFYESVERVVGRAADLEARIDDLEDQEGDSETDVVGKNAGVAQDGLTDGERETLQALQELGGSMTSGDIADEVDATLQSVRSWLPKLAQAGHIRTVPDPTDGRRKLYSPAECEEGAADADEPSDGSETADGPSDDVEVTVDEPEAANDTVGGTDETGDAPGDVDGTVYIASNGGSPSQVFHVREGCPQLRNCADFVEKERSVVPNHRPCGTCVSRDLDEGLVAVASESPTKTYHRQEDCSKLKPATAVEVVEQATVPDHDPCTDCVPSDAEEGADEEDGGPTAAQICARNDVDSEELVEALDTATAVYHVQRDLRLSRDETEALLRRLGVFEAVDGGGHVPLDRAKSVVREHVSSAV